MNYLHINLEQAIDDNQLKVCGELFEMARTKVYQEGLLFSKDGKEYIAKLAPLLCSFSSTRL